MRSVVLIGMTLGLLCADRPASAIAVVPDHDAYRAIWVADAGANAVYRCTHAKCNPVGSGWSAPGGMCADHDGNVFVTDSGNSRIVEFEMFGGQVVYSDPGQSPSGCAASDRDRTLAVTNDHGTSGGNGNIVFYSYGSTNPTKTVTGVDVAFDYCTFYKNGSLYNSGTDASGTVHIGVVPRNASINRDTGITGFSAPGGLLVQATTRLLSISDPAANVIRQYTVPGLGYVGSLDYSGPSFAFVTYGIPNPLIWTIDKTAREAVAYDLRNGQRMRTLKGFSDPDGITATPIGEE